MIDMLILIMHYSMIYATDKHRHLICLPYSIKNLHIMAGQLNIKRCWFHRDHYDIPKRRIDEIESQCTIVSSKEIVRIIRSHQKSDINKLS
jgi:hypothetical protein